MIILLLLLGVFWVAPAIWAGNMAEEKGRSKGAFVILTLLIGWFGLLIAALISPDHHSATLPGRRPCPHCAEPIQRAASVCRFCGRDVEPAGPPPPVSFLDATGLICPKGHENPVGIRKCQLCGSGSLAPF